MAKFELLAPAGDLEKLKFAILYGADAVFIGGKRFSLRSRASNFTLEDIKEGCDFAHAHNAKIHVTCNIVMHNIDVDGVLDYLKDLESCGVDAIITSSLYILGLVKKHTKMEAHVSTQQSVSNDKAIALLKEMGADRVVLARELTLSDIENAKKKSDVDLEVFIHGGMCSSFSGRCMLSNNMTNRDANRGGCAHSCRWGYDIYKLDKKISNEIFTASSKDLCALRYIPKLIDLGVNSFKIEGRMKSLHYISTIVNTYRRLIDEYLNTGKINDMDQYEKDILKAENRETATGFLGGKITIDNQLFDLNNQSPTKEFVGICRDYDLDNHTAIIEQRNYFEPNSKLEVFTPEETYIIDVEDIKDSDGNVLDAARHPHQMIYFKTEKPIPVNSMLRLVME
ncbi:MAG: U32 family peptidase [Acholeplasmatales bacterium]|nr:U32 family peptidase [Acholeplasmatales bacterium]